MAIKYGSDEWAKALCAECNKSQAYKDAAKNWEGDMYFVTEPEGALKETLIMYIDLGMVNAARLLRSLMKARRLLHIASGPHTAYGAKYWTRSWTLCKQ